MNFIFESENGKLDVNNLKKLIKPNGSESDDYLTPQAADDFNKMVLAAKEEGVNIESSQGYRPLGSEEEGCSGKLFTQWCAWKKYKSGKGALAAKPGTSNHGLGLAVDISNCKKGGKVHNWLKDNAEKFNFFPFSKESWHWTYGFREGQRPSSTEVENEPESNDSFIPDPIPKKDTPEPSEPEKETPVKTTEPTKSSDEKDTDDFGFKNLLEPLSFLYKEEINKLNNLIIETLQMVDDSGSSTFKSKPLKDDKYFILHHSVTKGDASGVVNILNKRGLGIQWVIDRDGVVHQTLGRGMKGAHVKSFGRSAPSDLSNSTSQGVEIVAMNDDDILLKQCKSALLLVKSLGYSLSNVYGHGEVSTNKALNEGATCKAYLKKYWNTPEDKLPEVDPELSTKTSYEIPTKEKDSKEIKKDIKITQPEKETPVKTTEPTKSSDEKDTDDFGFKSLLEPLSFLYKEEKNIRLTEEVDRMKQLFKYQKGNS